MTDRTYAGHTLAEIKAAAEGMRGWALDEVRRSGEDEICEFGTELDGEWYPIGSVDGQTYTGEPDDDIKIGSYIVLANPATVLAMAARVEELERDAMRYRWLRDEDDDLMACRHIWSCDEYPKYDEVKVLFGHELDAAIDAAMEQTKNREGA